MRRVVADRPGLVLLLLVGLLVAAALATLYLPTATSEPTRDPNELVEPKPGENVIWGYTSAGHSVHQRTLAINVIIHGDAEHVRYHLTEQIDATWNETEEEWEDINPDEGERDVRDQNATVIQWSHARGADRYVYVYDRRLTEERPNTTTRRPHQAQAYVPEAHEESGQWIAESYQLHNGEYFGTRDHIRVYESPYESDEWVVIQAHSEHWDWFRLRHTVDGIEDAQSRLEAEFMGQPYVDDVWRMYLANDESQDGDGWATIIELGDPPPGVTNGATAAIALLLARPIRTGRRRASHTAGPQRTESPVAHDGRSAVYSRLASYLLDRMEARQVLLVLRWITFGLLFTSLLVLYLGVRAGGIFLEQHVGMLSPKVIAALLYPVLAFGLPLCAWVLARRIPPVKSFALAAAGLGMAIVVDYSYLNIAMLPIEVVLHRVGVTIAIGLLAAAATTRDSPVPTVNQWFGTGVLLWVFLLLAPLVGWL